MCQMTAPAIRHAISRQAYRNVLAVSALIFLGCGPRIVTIKFPDTDPNTDYVVCDQRGEKCRGKRLEDVPPTAYEPGLDVLVPKEGTSGACPNGPRTIEVVIKGKHVTVVGYECAAPRTAPPAADGTGGTLTDGLPEEPPLAPGEEAAPEAEEGAP
jgi:hypothetical protein